MKKFLAALMVVSLTATSAYAGPRGNNRGNMHHNSRPVVQKVVHRAPARTVKVKHSNNVGGYLLAGLVGGVIVNSLVAASTPPQVVYNTVPVQVPTHTNNVTCTTTVSYDGRSTTETCTTVNY